ncbi:MAG: SDR family oxidoreductase [Oscillospiraceae bacterium]|nr:SDR family oxidoreductase [Oscillospiraceae bacterium]
MPKVYSGDLTKMFDISGKKAMIFGGAGGFGEAIAEGYAANGCSVCISSRSEEKLQAAVARIEAKAAPGVKVMYMAGDAGDEEFVKKTLEVVTSAEGLGGVDILVNAQGINKKMWSYEIDTEFFEKMLHTNITSLMLTSKYFGNWMKNNNLEGQEPVEIVPGQPNTNKGYGKIINFGSVRGIRAVANGGGGNVPYNTTKGAVEMLTKAYAADLRPNIQVNAIGPTITYTPMMVGILPPDENVRNGIAGSLPAMRIGYEVDVVGPAIFLASAASDMVTATTIYPDGGLVATS